jgi:hypothetical protein
MRVGCMCMSLCAEVGGRPVREHDLVPGVREGARGVELREDGEPRVRCTSTSCSARSRRLTRLIAR